jgi:hypothetical protein
MVVIRKQYSGADLIQEDLLSYNFTATEEEDAYYNPPSNDERVEGLMQLTHAIVESNNFHWNYVRVNWTYSTLIASEVFEALFQLYGVTLQGDDVLLGEQSVTTIGTETTDDILFDLKQCVGLPPLINLPGTTTAGKIRLNLPFKFENYEDDSIKLYYNSGGSSVTQDTGTDSNYYITFTTPGGLVPGEDCYVYVEELNDYIFETNTVPVSNQSILRLGYDNPNNYAGLRVKILIDGDSDYNVTINSIDFCYEVN